jgi:hypothetical protein
VPPERWKLPARPRPRPSARPPERCAPSGAPRTGPASTPRTPGNFSRGGSASRGGGTPEKQTGALRDAEAATQVAQGEQAAAEGAATARALADRDLEAARARVTIAEDALRAAQELADSPGRALYSLQTCAENVVHLVRTWDTLQPMEQQLVRNAISMLAMLTGLYDDIKSKGGAEREAELEGQAQQRGPGFDLGPAMGGAVAR